MTSERPAVEEGPGFKCEGCGGLFTREQVWLDAPTGDFAHTVPGSTPDYCGPARPLVQEDDAGEKLAEKMAGDIGSTAPVGGTRPDEVVHEVGPADDPRDEDDDGSYGRLVNIRRRAAGVRAENPTHWAAAYRDDVVFLLDGVVEAREALVQHLLAHGHKDGWIETDRLLARLVAEAQAGGGDEALEAAREWHMRNTTLPPYANSPFVAAFLAGAEWRAQAGGGLRAALDELLAAMREPDWVKSAPGFDTYSFSDRFAAAVERAVALVATPQGPTNA